MPQKKSILLFGFLTFLSLFSGCAGLQKDPLVKTYFDLDIHLPAAHQKNICKGKTLLVKELAIAPAFDSHSFIYRIAENEYINDYYNEFISYPEKLITEKIIDSLCASSHFTPSLTNMKQNINFRLSGKITRLYGDYQRENNPKSIIEIRMVLEKNTGKVFKAVLSQTYLAEEPISAREPAQLVLGWNRGLEKILIQFISEYNGSS